jgi:hypothetical protein
MAEPTFAKSLELKSHQTDSAEISLYRPGPVPHDEKDALQLKASSLGSSMVMSNPNPGFFDQILVRMGADTEGGKLEFFPAGDYPAYPSVRMGVEPMPFSPGVLEFMDPSGDFPHDPYIKMGFDPTPFASGKLEFYDPGSGWADRHLIKLGFEPSPFHAASLRMYNPEIGPPPKMMEMVVDDSASEWRSHFNMFVTTARAAENSF